MYVKLKWEKEANIRLLEDDWSIKHVRHGLSPQAQTCGGNLSEKIL